MPTFTRGKKRDSLVFVLINDFVYFGFKPKEIISFAGITASDNTALGHTAASAVFTGRLRIIGANAPKPPRVSKKIANATISQQQSLSTYCGYDSIATAQAAGWNLTKTKTSVLLKSPSPIRASLTAIAKLSDESLYCFPMNKADFESFGAELGLDSATTITTDAERKRLVSGSSIPYPGRASKKIANSSFSSFFSSAVEEDVVNAGYEILSEEKVIIPEAVPFFR